MTPLQQAAQDLIETSTNTTFQSIGLMSLMDNLLRALEAELAAVEKIKRNGWINIHTDSTVQTKIFASKAEADFEVEKSRCACLPITWMEQVLSESK